MDTKLTKLIETLSALEMKNDVLHKEINDAIDKKQAYMSLEADLMNQQEELKKDLNFAYEQLGNHLRKGIVK